MTNPTLQKALLQLIADDAYAATFQNMSQYRTALLKRVDGLFDGAKPFATGGVMPGELHLVGESPCPFIAPDLPHAETRAQAGQLPPPEGFVLMPRRLTAENGAKGLLMGEFSESVRVTCHECDGSGDDSEFDSGCVECSAEGTIEQKVPVEWDTIKRIYDMAVEHLSAPSPAKESK